LVFLHSFIHLYQKRNEMQKESCSICSSPPQLFIQNPSSSRHHRCDSHPSGFDSLSSAHFYNADRNFLQPMGQTHWIVYADYSDGQPDSLSSCQMVRKSTHFTSTGNSKSWPSTMPWLDVRSGCNTKVSKDRKGNDR